MSKKNKKNRWFSKVSSFAFEDKQTKDLFGNSIKKHEERISKIKQDAEEREYLIEDDSNDDYGYSSYNWDLDRKLMQNQDRSDDGKKKKQSYEYAKNDFGNSYNSYQGGGEWRGYSYFQQPQLSYKYVQQMANALAASHKVKVEIGNEWKVDLIGKTLTYNPASLIYGTKGELLATLMHEIGKLRYCTHSSFLKNKYITMYDLPPREVLSIYEDVRTDYLMLKSYESAGEVYESVIPIIEKQVKEYSKKGAIFKELVVDMARNLYNETADKYYERSENGGRIPPDDNCPQFKEDLLMIFGDSDARGIRDRLEQAKIDTSLYGTIFEYCGEMVSLMYDLDEDPSRTQFENIKEKVKQTIGTIEPSKKKIDSQTLVDFLDEKTFPFIEDLLKDFTDKNQQLEKMFPKMPEATKQSLMRTINSALSASGSDGRRRGKKMVNIEDDGEVKSRTSQTSNCTIPPEWTTGEYKPIKDSVQAEIKQLVNRLTYIRREELVVRYQSDQKRGKLNCRKLYKSATGSRRLFKQQLPNVDTVQSFAFSLLIDISGSMKGNRIVHTTRAVVILEEVFKKMGIPFELVTFNTGAKTIKSFDQEMNKSIENKIGGLVRAAASCTNMNRGLDELKIQSRPEKNKIVIVLTDGGVDNIEYYDSQYFIPWEKKGIKSVGFGIECESHMKNLCQGNSRVLDNASKLPVEFSNLLKQIIKRK